MGRPGAGAGEQRTDLDGLVLSPTAAGKAGGCHLHSGLRWGLRCKVGAETRNGVKSSSWGLQLQLWLELSLRATHASKWKYVCGWMRTFQRTQCP